MRVPRVLFVDHTAVLSGAELALRRLIAKIDRERYEPVVLLFEEGPLASAMRSDGVHVEIVHAPVAIVQTRRGTLTFGALKRAGEIPSLVRMLARLRAAIRRIKPDLIHTNSLKSDLLTSLAVIGLKTPVIWHIHDRIATDYMPATAVKAFRLACRHLPDYVIANSKATLVTLGRGIADKAKPCWPATEQSMIAIIHPGVDRVARSPRVTLRPTVGMVGRLSPWKGQDVLLEAAPTVLTYFPETRFRIVGSAMFGEQEYEQSLQNLATKLGIADRVEFVPFTTEIEKIYESLGILVHASKLPEPFGQVVAEGMATGLPVVAARAGGVVEIVDDGITGILIEPSDPPALSQAILMLLMNPSAAVAMGNRARLHVQEAFGTARSVKTLSNFYDNVYSRRQTS
jgi:glycosyltransferase involved in cell wall biosynthesis